MPANSGAEHPEDLAPNVLAEYKGGLDCSQWLGKSLNPFPVYGQW